MINLYDGGAYLVNGMDIIPDNQEAQAAIKAKTGKDISREEASKETIAYGILEEHNTSGNMDKLKIKFDKLTSHDITFVGDYTDGAGIRAGEVPGAVCAYQLP